MYIPIQVSKTYDFHNFDQFCQKMAKNEKMQNSQISLKFFQGSQFLLKLAEICTR